jgi:diguanylate cyclase (GGDEF)-like protein
MVEATRWLFAVLAMASLLITVIAPLAADDLALRLATLVVALALGCSIATGYSRRAAPLELDVLDAAAILALALVCPTPIAALAFVFGALWFRSLYGSARRAVLRCVLYGVALCASLPLWTYLPGHSGSPHVAAVAGVIPTMFLTVVVGRHLASSLQAREQSTQRYAVHLSLGSQLLGVTDRDEVRRIAWTSIAAICAVTPGLRVLKIVREGAELRVDRWSGEFAARPLTLPAAVLSAHSRAHESPSIDIDRHAELDAAVGVACVWASIPLPGLHSEHEIAWLLMGSPHKVAPEAVVSISTLADQVTLALRNSEVHQELTVQATLDSLTGLANRATFNAALSAALDDKPLLSSTILFIDLDDFKDVNDAFGHRAGDDLLREVAARLVRATRPGDLCARLGGDEFAVLLRRTAVDVAEFVADRIVQAIAAPMYVGSDVAHLGASVGVATAASDADVEQLVHRADVAMYAAKANGKGRFQIFEPSLLHRDLAQVTFERKLAAAARNGELVVHYQPVLTFPDLRCTAVEALVRWRHPERGLLYPDAFIEVAERIGAIREIGAFVLRQACADTAAWRDEFPSAPLAIHVNVSALQLDDEGFFDSVIRCLRDFALPAEQLVLEITESLVISSPAAIDRLNALAGHGVTIAIDDFGTGYSALTTLRTLPVQIVKVDKSFVSGSTLNPQDRAVTEAVVTMASQMGLQTIAEGVERLDQEQFLRSIGADAVQGYLYLRPSTAEDFTVWLGTHLAGIPRVARTSDIVVPFKPRHIA